MTIRQKQRRAVALLGVALVGGGLVTVGSRLRRWDGRLHVEVDTEDRAYGEELRREEARSSPSTG